MNRNHLQIPALLLLLLVTACGSATVGMESLHTAAKPLVWPSSPGEPRIRFDRSLVSASDLGIRPSLFQRLINRISGNNDEHFVRPTGVAEHDGII